MSTLWTLGALVTACMFCGAVGTVSAQSALTLNEPVYADQRPCQMLSAGKADLRSVSLKQTFYDDFRGLNKSELGSRTGRGWRGYFANGAPEDVRNHTLMGNQEKQIYVYPSYPGNGSQALGLDPFVLNGDGITIKARRIEGETQRKQLYNFDYFSGVLQSYGLFSQKYGYFEVNAKMPTGKAMWPAFWLVNRDLVWPPEIDVFEMFDGANPSAITMTTHWKDKGYGSHQMTICHEVVPDADRAFHTYGVLWNDKRITYYLDRRPVATLSAPPGLNQPAYMILNLAVSQAADKSSPVEAAFDVKWVAVYQY